MGFSVYSEPFQIKLLNKPIDPSLLPIKPVILNATFDFISNKFIIKWNSLEINRQVFEISLTFTILGTTGLPLNTVTESNN